MDSDIPTPLTRRRLLHASVLGLTTGIAGCQRVESGPTPDPGDEVTPPELSDTRPDDPTRERPDTPPATFRRKDDREFSYHRIPPLEELPDTIEPFPATGGAIPPDNRIFHITVKNENTAHATIENVNVERDIELTLHVRDATNNYHPVTDRLTATDTDAYETREASFDISDITLPTDGTGGFCILTATDTHPGDDVTAFLKRHQFIALPHEGSLNWINSEVFNPDCYHTYEGELPALREAARGVTINGEDYNTNASPAGVVEHHDTDDTRTVFLATINSITNELFGVATTISHDPYNQWKNGSATYRTQYGAVYEGAFATEIGHFRDLAQSTATVIDNLGITSAFNRLESLGDLIQMIPYLPQRHDPPPTHVLYDSLGDCSSKAVLMSCILQNDPWNIMPAYIGCDVNGTPHETIGLDVDDLGADYDNSLYTISPSEHQIESSNWPDNEYVFFDMTFDSTIGQRVDGIENPHLRWMGDFSLYSGSYSDNPPNY